LADAYEFFTQGREIPVELGFAISENFLAIIVRKVSLRVPVSTRRKPLGCPDLNRTRFPFLSRPAC
jgi:hypothetical protein